MLDFIPKNFYLITSLIGEFFVIVDKDDNLNLQSAIKTSLATFLIYFTQENASELYNIVVKHYTECSYKIINNKNDIKYISENILDYIDYDNGEEIIYQNDHSIEDLLGSIIVEKKDKYIFLYNVSYD